MTSFNLQSIPGFGSSSEKRVAPEILSFAFYGRKPKIAGAVAKLRVVANSNPGIEVAPQIRPASVNPEVSIAELDRREQLRQAVAGNDLLAPALQEDTSQADWIARLEQIAKDEANGYEYPRAA